MARNKVQFQKGLSEVDFEALYGTEEKCRAVVIASRWPNGFECPLCRGQAYSEVTTRGLFQCSACRRQTSPIAGTLFASTHVPLRIGFRAMYHLTQSKQDISSIEESMQNRGGVTLPLIELDHPWRTESPDSDGGRHPRASRSAQQYERRERAARSSCSSASVVSCSCAWPRSR
jgi:ribosomal protein L37AE/L43A